MQEILENGILMYRSGCLVEVNWYSIILVQIIISTKKIKYVKVAILQCPTSFKGFLQDRLHL